ncbi:hypothetical protein QTH91_13720 [Variovorax dokdonensis]|uniref:Uncharacterized protein n=1 Tax=Variovorax dokdonensis TaxID=344883 RepID=A0ABT7NC94_9BURK|nr:hypothetical protein [Variovorax dokdonensis]MDM0045546.1 hypothetical protein [Variovorax dokdonensis]
MAGKLPNSKLLIALLLVLLASNLNAQVVMCFQEDNQNPRNPIRLKMTLSASDPLTATVQYNKSENEILLSKISEKKLSTDVPVTTESKWLEKIGEKANGIYALTTRGAAVGALSYTRKDGKRFLFFDDPDCVASSGGK